MRSLYSLCTRLTDLIPDWIPIVVAGTFLIFSCFGLVQLVFLCAKPSKYIFTEICYCVLSLTSKMFLGAFLAFNVLGRARYEDALDTLNIDAPVFNYTGYCAGDVDYVSIYDMLPPPLPPMQPS